MPNTVHDHPIKTAQTPLILHDTPVTPRDTPQIHEDNQHHNNALPVANLPVSTTQTQNLRRSNRNHRPLSHLQDYQCLVKYPIQAHLSYNNLTPSYKDYINQISTIYEPPYFHQAVSDPKWRHAMVEEITALEASNTWSIESLPQGKRTVGCRWIYKVKYRADWRLPNRKKVYTFVKGNIPYNFFKTQDTWHLNLPMFHLMPQFPLTILMVNL